MSRVFDANVANYLTGSFNSNLPEWPVSVVLWDLRTDQNFNPGPVSWGQGTFNNRCTIENAFGTTYRLNYYTTTNVRTGNLDRVTSNVWGVWVATISSATLRSLYFDGSGSSASSNASASIGSIPLIRFGIRADLAAAWRGTLGQAAVYDRVLSAAEIDSLAGGANPMALSPIPISYWAMDTDTGATIPGQGSDPFDLTVVGTVAFSANNPPVDPASSPPADPTLLSATGGVVSGRISLAWTDNADNEDNYTVERSDDGASWVELTSTLPADTEAYNDDGLANGVTWHYRVKATNATDESGYSNSDSAVTATTPAAPSALSVVPQNKALGLAWTNNHSPTDGSAIAIERSADGTTGWSQIDTVAIDVAAYVDTGLNDDETWFYRVRVLNGSFPSDYSNTVSGTTAAAQEPKYGFYDFRMPGFGLTHDRGFTMTGEFAGNVKRLVGGVWVDATAYRLKGGVWVPATVKRLESGSWQ